MKSIEDRLYDIISRLKKAEDICYRADLREIYGERSFSYAVGYSKVCMMRISEELQNIINELKNDPR